MFIKKFWSKKKENQNIANNNILVAALLIHAAKIDDNYTDYEKKIISKALVDLKLTTSNESEKLIKRIAIPAALVTDSPRPLMQVTQANIEKMIGFMVLISMTKQRPNV